MTAHKARSRSLLASSLALVFCILATSAAGQFLQVDSTECSIYNRAAVQCQPPIEVYRHTSAFFPSYFDSAFVQLRGCNPEASAWAITQNLVDILPDSIYIHQQAVGYRSNQNAPEGHAKSDARIVFHVNAGLRYTYRIHGTLYSFNRNGGETTAITTWRLSRRSTTVDSVVAAWYLQAGPGPPQELARGFLETGSIGPGEYVYEAHTSAEAAVFGWPEAEQWLRLRLRDVTTAVEASTWAGVKSLYR